MEIELSNISYKDKLNNFNYKFSKNKVTSIMGRSGSGKSLIGYIIMDLINYDNGSIIIDGRFNYDKHKLMKDIGYVFQNPMDHFFSKTVGEEIGFGLKQFRFKLDKQYEHIIDSLKMVGLSENFYDRKINGLSSGEAEMVAIASSLVLNPKVLILDEPTVYLDYKAKNKLVKLIKMLRDKYHKTIIIMSNDVEFIYQVSDEYVFMDNCNIVSGGNIKDIMTNSNLLNKYGYEIPNISKFINLVKDKKNIELNYTNNINELVMDVMEHER